MTLITFIVVLSVVLLLGSAVGIIGTWIGDRRRRRNFEHDSKLALSAAAAAQRGESVDVEALYSELQG